MWKRFLRSAVSFSSVKNLFLNFLKISNFKVKVCGREFFDSLKVWGVWKKAFWVVESVKFQVCQREFFTLLQASSEISSLCNRVLHWVWKLYPYPTHSCAWVNYTHPLPTHGTLSIPITHPTYTHQSITKIKLLKSTLKSYILKLHVCLSIRAVSGHCLG